MERLREYTENGIIDDVNEKGLLHNHNNTIAVLYSPLD